MAASDVRMAIRFDLSLGDPDNPGGQAVRAELRNPGAPEDRARIPADLLMEVRERPVEDPVLAQIVVHSGTRGYRPHLVVSQRSLRAELHALVHQVASGQR